MIVTALCVKRQWGASQSKHLFAFGGAYHNLTCMLFLLSFGGPVSECYATF